MTRDKKIITKKNIKEEKTVKKAELEEKIIQIDRVARVVAGGRRFRFRAAVVVGDKNGHVGIGIAKGPEVRSAISKATAYAKKDIVEVPHYRQTIPYQIEESFGGAHILLKPASPGTGIIAGGAVRAVLEVAGIHDVLSKILGSANKINNIRATFNALKKLRGLELKNKLRYNFKKDIEKSKD
jgi:small subunit ribosomal protein S5